MLYRTGSRDACTVHMEDSYALYRWVCELGDIMSTGFTNPSSETDVSTSCFLTQCCVNVYKYELYVRIPQIIADKFQSHAFSAGLWPSKYTIAFICPWCRGRH